MGTGKEWLTKIEKTKSFPTSEELRAQKVSPLTATSWVDAFARTIAHEASEELILSDRLRQRLEANANARSIRYPKTTSKISEKNGTQLKKHSGNSVSSMYNKVVSSEVSPKEVEIVFRYPTLGIDFTGRLTRDKIGTELIPKVIAALIQSGMDTEEVRKIIEKSLTPLVQSTEPILKITMRVQVILNNIVQRIAQPIKTEPAKSSIEPVPAIPAKASRNLDFKQKQKIRGSVQAMEQKGDTWQHPGQDRHEEEFLNWQLKQGDGSTLPQNSSATTYVQIPNVGSGPRIPNASMQHADVDWKDEYQDWQGVPKAGDTASTADAVDIEGEESISVLATPIESIDFKSLETVEGRETIFRQMVAMYNTVRNQRDILGFEGKKNLKNADFDAYASFRKRYLMLRKKIGEFAVFALKPSSNTLFPLLQFPALGICSK